MDYDGIKYPFAKEHLFKGSCIDERGKGGKKTKYTIEHLRQFFKLGDTVLDFGAYIGTHSISLALLGGIVHALKPHQAISRDYEPSANPHDRSTFMKWP